MCSGMSGCLVFSFFVFVCFFCIIRFFVGFVGDVLFFFVGVINCRRGNGSVYVDGSIVFVFVLSGVFFGSFVRVVGF